MKRRGVFRAVHSASDWQDLFKQFERFVPTTDSPVRVRQVMHRRERLGVLRAKGGEVVVPCLFLQRDGLAREAEAVVGPAQRALQLRPLGWLGGEVGVQLLRGLVESFGYGYGASVARWVGTLEDFAEEIRDALRVLARQFLRVAFGCDLHEGFGGFFLRPRGTHRLPGAHHSGDHEHGGDGCGDAKGGFVPPDKPAELVARARRRGAHCFVGEEVCDVLCKGVGGFVTARAVFLDGLHHDPVEIWLHEASEFLRLDLPGLGKRGAFISYRCAQAGRRLRRLHLTDDSTHFIVTRGRKGLGIEGRLSREQLVEQDAQGVDVTARVDIQTAQSCLFWAHIHWRADKLLKTREERLVSELALRGFSDAKVDDLGYWLVTVQGDQDIGWLDVAMDNAFLVRVIDG